MRFQIRGVLGAILLLTMSGTAAVRGAVNHVDFNGDGITDQQNILAAVKALAAKGVTFNDEDPGGHRPVFRNGLYQMCCIDLILVAYRAAGYDLCKSVGGGPLLYKGDYLGYTGGAGGARSVANVSAYARRSPDWKYSDLSGVDPMSKSWIPSEPFQPGEMVFIDYTCSDGRRNSDRHSGIVTEVDPVSGRPTRIAQISTYNRNQGLQEVSMGTLFNLYCRRLTGRARPTSWGVPDRVVVAAVPRPAPTVESSDRSKESKVSRRSRRVKRTRTEEEDDDDD